MTTELRHAIRQLAQRPLWTALVVGVLALGIGATTAIFSITDAVLFRPLPIEEPERVVRVFRVDQAGQPNNNLAFPSFADLRDHAASFSHVAAYQDWAPFNMALPGHEPARVAGAVVTGGFFELFAVPPLLGRYLLPSDDVDRGGHPLVVLGERVWRSHYGADPDIIGRTLTINTHPFTVIGVMPRRFGGPSAQPNVDAWVPMAMMEQAAPMEQWGHLGRRGVSWLDGVARLTPGTSLAAAQSEVDAIVARIIEAEGINPDQVRLGLITAAKAAVDPYGFEGSRRKAWLLLGVSAVLLLIAMTNAAGLLLVRTEERARELALRLGVGAARGRLLRMLLVEALCHALLGAALGVVLGHAVLSGTLGPLAAMLSGVPDEPSLLLDVRVLVFALGLAVVTAIVAVVSPALRVMRLDINAALKQGGSRSDRGRTRVRDAMVVGQTMLAVSLLALALLLVRSFWHTTVVDPGFDARQTLTASVDLLRQGYPREGSAAVQQAIIERLQAHPAVDSAAFVSVVPVQAGGMRSTFRSPDAEIEGGTTTDINFISPGYFDALRIPLLRGRALGPVDVETAPRAVVINQAFAARWFAGVDPLGKRLQILGGDQEWEIVGIVADSKLRNMRESPQPSAYFALAQRPDPQASILVRGRGDDPWALLPVLREALQSIDPALPLFRTRTLVDHVGRSYIEARVMAWMLAAVALLAVLLTAAGLYGLLSWQVRVRSREIGIRLALGATATAVRRTMLTRGLTLAALGIPLGLLAAVGTGRLLEGMLFGVAAHDPLTLAAVTVGFLLLAAIAIWIPARRSSRIDPMLTLRDE